MGLQWCPVRVHGCSLVWDVACPDTFAHSYLALSRHILKKDRLQNTPPSPPILTSCLSQWPLKQQGPNAQSFLRELGHCLSVATSEQRSYSFLLQRLAVAVQRGNAASVSGTHVSSDVFY